MSTEGAVRERLSAAFRRAYEDAELSQEALSEALGLKQSLISKYARAAVQPPLDVLERVEDACGFERGHILRLAGFVSDKSDLLAAIKTDPNLSEDGRDVVAGVYDFCVRRAAEERARVDPAEPIPATVSEFPSPPLDPWHDLVPDLENPNEADVWSVRDLDEDYRRFLVWRLRQEAATPPDEQARRRRSG